MVSVDIALVDFSTGKHHQLARKPVIHVHDVEEVRELPMTVIDIAGDHLLLATMYHPHDDEANDHNLLYIFDWKSGSPRMASTIFYYDTFLFTVSPGSSCYLEYWCYVPR